MNSPITFDYSFSISLTEIVYTIFYKTIKISVDFNVALNF